MSVIISYVKYALMWVCVELVLHELTDAGKNGLFLWRVFAESHSSVSGPFKWTVSMCAVSMCVVSTRAGSVCAVSLGSFSGLLEAG